MAALHHLRLTTRPSWRLLRLPIRQPPEAEPTPSIPSGALAIFYRVTFGSNMDYLKGSGYNISWDKDTKGIMRYIPEPTSST